MKAVVRTGDAGTDGEPAVATYAVLGDPVSHSLSPAIQNAAFRAGRRRARYVARKVSAQECGPVLRELALKGGGGNVTVPHKERVVPFLDRHSPAVSATGACNTFWAEDGMVWGDNTDVGGFLGAWAATVGGMSGGLRVLVLGAGGAGRAVVCALLQAPRVERVLLWNRTPGRAAALALHFSDPRITHVRQRRGLGADVLVNATSVGLDGRERPVDLASMRTVPRRIIDLVYGRGATPLCRQARELGISAVDGREMLVRQAEAAYARWFGEPPPRGVMARALDSQDW